MRTRGNWIIYLLSFLLIGLSAMLSCMEDDVDSLADHSESTENREPFSVVLQTQNKSETINLWYDGQNTYYAFLPGFSQEDKLTLAASPGQTVQLNGIPVNEDFPKAICFEEAYALQRKEQSDSEEFVVFLRSDALPAVCIDVQSGDMTFLHGNKEREEQGSMRIYLPDGTLHYSGNLESIKGRGNATWDKEKKPYNISLRQEADLLGMGQAGKWALLANAFDPTHLRNKIVYETAREMGLSYTPQSRWVDLYLNGEYAGIYLLCEKNEIHPQRVDMDSESGNLISVEKEDRLWEYGENQFVTQGGTPVRIRSTTNAPVLMETVHTMERAILSEDGVDPQTGQHWLQLIDLDSWAAKYLIEEVFGNLDAGSISQFFYWDSERDGKIYAGPVWDYDVSMGSPNHWQLQDPNMLYSGRPHLWNREDSPWFYSLYQKPEFRERVARIYETKMRPILTELLHSGIQSYSDTIQNSARMNALRWNAPSSREKVEELLSFMARRQTFLDEYWLENKDFFTVQLFINWNVMGCYAIAPGEKVPEQPVPGGWDTITYAGWYDADTEELYDFSRPVTADIFLYLKEVDISTGEAITSSGSLSGKIWFIPSAVVLFLFAVVIAEDAVRIIRTEKSKKTVQWEKPAKSR